MKRKIHWEWLHSFLAVARGGGLTGASRFSELSVPTLSRHMQMLETALGQKLFERGMRGFTLTAQGQKLFDHTQAMGDIADAALRENADDIKRDVRISLGNWTASYVSEKFAETYDPKRNWRPLMITNLSKQDIARGEVDLGVRNHVPESQWLAAQKFGNVRYGICRAVGFNPSGFIGFEKPIAPTALWIERNGGIFMRVGNAELGIPYLKQGLAKMVLPLFITDRIDGIEVLNIVDELTSPQYLIMHQDRRHEPHIRAAIRAISPILEQISAF